MLKCKVKITNELQKELNENIWIISLISLIVGSILIGCYIIIGSIFDKSWLDIFLWVGAITFAWGLTMFITVNKINKKSTNRNLVDEIELNEEYFEEKITKNNEVISTTKHYYKDLIKVKETTNYLFLYENRASATPIPKNAFSKEEFTLIKVWANASKIKKSNC